MLSTDIAVDGFRTVTTNAYDADDFNTWRLGRLTHAKVVSSGHVDTANSVRESAWTYYPNGVLQSETIEPGQPALSLTKTYTYTTQGVKETEILTDSTGTELQQTSYGYEPLGRFVTSVAQVVNGVEHKVTTGYDLLAGQPERVEDLNGHVATFQYDGYGRQTRTDNLTDGTWTETTLQLASGLNSTAWVVDSLFGTTIKYSDPVQYVVHTTDQNGAWTKVYYNRFGDAFEQHAPNQDGQIVGTVTEYDAWDGSVYRVSSRISWIQAHPPPGKPLRNSMPFTARLKYVKPAMTGWITSPNLNMTG